MIETAKTENGSGWMCNQCNVPLEVQTIRLQYLRVIFALHLPVCPKCGIVLIAEDLATGKMAEAEQVLEDK